MLVAAGSGMSPIWSILHDHLASGEQRPVYFFYGARTQRDLFHLDGSRRSSDASRGHLHSGALARAPDDATGRASSGFVHERVQAPTSKELACRRRGRRLRLRPAADDRRASCRCCS